MYRDGHSFLNEQNFENEKNLFVKKGVVQKKKIKDELTKCIVQRNKKNIVFQKYMKKQQMM